MDLHSLKRQPRRPRERRSRPVDGAVSFVVTLSLHGLILLIVLWRGGSPPGGAMSASGRPSTGASQTDGLVVMFISVPTPRVNEHRQESETSDVAVPPETPSMTEPARTAVTHSEQARVTARSAGSAVMAVHAASPTGAAGAIGAAGGGNTENDNSAYVDALRRAIATKWEVLHPGQAVPECALSIEQAAGGQVNSATATCPDSEALQRALEATALMAQPLPYKGYEAEFVPQLQLNF